MTAKVPFVGLTGSIAAGKSTALEALRHLGVPVLSTDVVVHDLYRSELVRDAVTERWGLEVAPDGVVDRSLIAVKAFATPEERLWLEGLLWPLVGEKMAQWRERVSASKPPPRALVVEVPLLFESDMERAYDATIVIVADEEVRDQRARARGQVSLDERNARQLSQEEKARRASYVVTNDGSLEELEAKLSVILDKLAL
ncbi:MAG: dephospho-CoA kinase [Solirubrobacterales bacterium]|nr:dephospho-CoA kinase [Solirubrobacterales bacterium]